jgi:hypothetical protein
VGALLAGASDERSCLKLLTVSQQEHVREERIWQETSDLVAHYRSQGECDGYHPVSVLSRFPAYAAPHDEIAAARSALPCVTTRTGWQVQQDDRDNQYIHVYQEGYCAGLSFSTRHTQAQHGPAFVWHRTGGTIILSENGNRPCWETRAGTRGTGQGAALARVRDGRGGCEVLLRYEDLGLTKRYVYRPDEIDVLVGARGAADSAIHERIPLLLRTGDVVCLDYGRCLAQGIGSRSLGVVSQTLVIERAGRSIVRFDFGAPTSVTLRPTYDPGGFIRVVVDLALPAIYFGRRGYKVHITN